MVDLSRQTERIKEEINLAIESVVSESQFINGPDVLDFEKSLERFVHCNHVISCGNGTDALQMSLMAIDAKPGDEVIIPSFGYVSAAEVTAMLGLVPVFVDVDLVTYNIDVSKIEEAISPKTKAIIPVHLFGQLSDMTEIMQIADKHDISVIEDNAQSLGAKLKKTAQRSGTIGHIGCTSFFPTKNLGCFGDGGALMTNDANLANKLRMLSKHGQSSKYFHDVIGMNSRLDTIQAAILNVKLKYLESYIESRRKVAAFYGERLSLLSGIILPVEMDYADNTYNQYTIRIKGGRRDELKLQMGKKSVPSMIYYPRPLHQQKSLIGVSRYVTRPDQSERLSNEVLSLPMHTELSEDQLGYICDVIIDFFN